MSAAQRLGRSSLTELSGTENFDGWLDAVPDAAFVVATDGSIVACNSQAVSMFGYQQEELVNQPIEVLLPERFRQTHVGHRSVYFEAPRVRPRGIGLELFGRRRDGSEVPVEISLSPATMRGRLVAIASVRDVSERKRL